MGRDIDLFPILRQYSCLAPPNTIHLPRTISRQKLQDFLLGNILNSNLLTTYPPSSQYQRSFWKLVLIHLETNYDEDEDFELASDIYGHYLGLLQDQPTHSNGLSLSDRRPKCKSYATYHWKPPKFTSNVTITTTLLESTNMIENGTTGLRTWGAAFFLAQYFIDNTELILEKRILELGSGIGFMGTVISSLQVLFHSQKDSLPQIWLTDVDETVLSNCRSNIELPCNLSSCHGNVTTARLDWFDALDPEASPRLRFFLREEINPDLIVGSDVVFDPSLILPLLSTIKIAIENSDKIALFAATVRNEDTMFRFLTSARELGLHFEEHVNTRINAESILPNGIIKDMDAVKLLLFSAKP